MVKEHSYKFDSIYETDGYAPYHVARIYTGNNVVVRMVFTTDGIKLFIPSSCKNNGDIIWLEENIPGAIGLGKKE